MPKLLHIHLPGRTVTLNLARGRARDKADEDDPHFEVREAWIEALLAKLEELEKAGAKTADDGSAGQKGHPFYGNQYTDVVLGPKPTEAKEKKSVKAALHELLTSGHPFTLEELMAATGSKSKSNLTTAITHLKGSNPHPLGTLNILKNAQGQYHLDHKQPPVMALEPKTPAAAAPAPTGSAQAPSAAPAPAPAPAAPKLPSAGLPVAKAPASPMSVGEADTHYAQALAAANNKVLELSKGNAKTVTQVAQEWKGSKALAMAQWKANTTGKDQNPLPVEVFPEDKQLMFALADTEGDPDKVKKALADWKEATHKAKIAAANKAAAPAPAPASAPAASPAPAKTPLAAATPTGPSVFEAPKSIVPDDHEHISADDFLGGAHSPYSNGISTLHEKLHASASDAISNKKQVQHALDERLKASHHFQSMEAQHKASGKAYYGSLSASLVQAWAGSSGDGHHVSVSAQLSVRDAFGMGDSVETKAFQIHTGSNDDQIHKQAAQNLGIDVSTPEKLASYKAGMKDFVLAQYHETQDHLAKLGVKELHLVRGMKVGGGSVGARKVNVKLQPASSFTTAHNIAKSFASSHSLFVVKVPASQVLGSFCTGYGCTSESEVVVLHHDSLQAVQVGVQHASHQASMVSHIGASDLGSKAAAPAKPKAPPKPGSVAALKAKLPKIPSGVKGDYAKTAKAALAAGDEEKFHQIVASTPPGKALTKKYLNELTQILMQHKAEQA